MAIVGSRAPLGSGLAGEQRSRSLELRQPGTQHRTMLSVLRLDMSGTVVLPSRLHETVAQVKRNAHTSLLNNPGQAVMLKPNRGKGRRPGEPS